MGSLGGLRREVAVRVGGGGCVMVGWVGWIGWHVCSKSRVRFFFGAQDCRLRSGFLNPRLILKF